MDFTVAPASLSRRLGSVATPPRLFHSIHQPNSSILCLAATESYIFGGRQSGDILVWDRNLYSKKTTLKGHEGSVLAMEYAIVKKWLISSSADSTVRVWDTVGLAPFYVLDPYLQPDAGDIYSLAWSQSRETVYFGCQNTSIQWIQFGRDPVMAPPNSQPRPVHKFFAGSHPQYQHTKSLDPPSAFVPTQSSNLTPPPAQCTVLSIPATNIISSAHHGYVYCMAVSPSPYQGSDDLLYADGYSCVYLVTGSGDESVKLWNCSSPAPVLEYTFDCGQGAVLSIAVRKETIYAGCQDGYIKVLDLETKTLVRTIIVHENVAVLSLSMLHSDLYSVSARGQIQRWSASFDCTAELDGHTDSIILSSVVTYSDESGQFQLVTGANDGYIKVWNIETPRSGGTLDGGIHRLVTQREVESTNDTMLYALSRFISIPSVSNSPQHREDCRQAAIWLKKCFNQLGASRSALVSTGETTNPLVLATFQGAGHGVSKKRVLFYGHYDVMAAPARDWETDPFSLSGRDGYLYGRGATDNKGPIMAVACAAAELLRRRSLNVDLVMMIEGEEESGSGGFREAVQKNKDLIGEIDAILISNSTWIDETTPCITYGLRGVVHCSIEIFNDRPDLHSGVEGGATPEPMIDMVKLLSKVTDENGKVAIPQFYEHVRPLTQEESELYERITSITKRPTESLSSKWREPSFTVHNIQVSGPRNPTVIPSRVKSQVSVRIVPDQNLETIAGNLCESLMAIFSESMSPNSIEVKIDHKADWWLGRLDDEWFGFLEASVRDEWGVTPLRIREGGSIPSVPYLEKEFRCHALHLPLGQSSDQAHLPNERISLLSLRKGKAVIERFLSAVGNA
ncbi:Zn-dependent exopeptidase [Thelephora terrestris]|uniref:Zn-dependent exopeptidase n=1 Tax=Thelephora terrestris TaxID=56493 RepID=A0A9P6L1J7_9AGAM|nr:Zn-dependent exopeptidase [Thelephora terrestris]